jgi:predicted house-cleaning noncanonical NTP pyrophosphatase (MazG superfamily)
MIKTRSIIQNKFHPDGYTIGINEGDAAGRTQPHLHIHLIPRYVGDVKNPKGGVRNIFSEKSDYLPEMKKMPSRKGYVNYNKLVRDKIPEIIRQKGKKLVTHIAADEEYWHKLKEKLKEEVDEFLKNSSEEELVDIFEVIYAIADFKKIDKEKLELLRKKKSEKRGGFKKKIILEETK